MSTKESMYDNNITNLYRRQKPMSLSKNSINSPMSGLHNQIFKPAYIRHEF